MCYCLDPKTNGHRKRGGDSDQHDPEAEREQRRQTIAGNKDWRSAETVRRRWLRELVARKTAPKAALRFIIESLARGDGAVCPSLSGTHAMARHLLGLPNAEQYGPDRVAAVVELLSTANDSRAVVIALGLIIGAYEDSTGVHVWRSPAAHSDLARYFAAPASWGYEPSAIEQAVIDGEPYSPSTNPGHSDPGAAVEYEQG
jgi:ParB family chromosome partitioning protein